MKPKKLSRIVILDRNDFSQAQRNELKAMAKDVEIFNGMPKDDDDAINRMKDADAAIVCWYSLSKKCIDACRKLKYLGVVATGYSWLAADHAAKKGVTVTNVPGYATKAVSDFIFRQLDFRPAGKTLGIIGFGRIGSRVAEIAKRKGFRVIYWNRTAKEAGFDAKPFDDVFAESDVIVLQVKACEGTFGIVKRRNLESAKPGAIIVNTVSPRLFEDEKHLIGLARRKGLRLILDFEEKSMLSDAAKANKDITLTSGIAWKSGESVFRLHQIAIENLESWIGGKTQNRI